MRVKTIRVNANQLNQMVSVQLCVLVFLLKKVRNFDQTKYNGFLEIEIRVEHRLKVNHSSPMPYNKACTVQLF